MALPTTITGISTAVACVGPFISSGGNVYFFGRNSTTAGRLDAMKGTAPATSFASIANTTSGLLTTIEYMAGYQVGDVIHLVVASETSITAVKYEYVTFNMSTDAFVLAEAIASSLNTEDSLAGPRYNCSIIVRSGGEVVVLFQGARLAVMGTSYSRVYYSRRTGVNTWSAAVEVDSGGQTDWGYPEAILGASDRVHFLWTWFFGTGNSNQRTLSSANVLQTASTPTLAAGFLQGVSYVNGANQKIVCGSIGTTSGPIAGCFTSSDTPTVASNTASNIVGSGFIVALVFNNGTTCYFVDMKGSAATLEVSKSTDDGATWGAFSTIFTAGANWGAGANQLSIDGNIFTRGGAVVIPYVVNDNGTLKYNEYSLGTSYNQSCLGSTTPTKSLSRSTGKILRRAETPNKVFLRSTSKSLRASTTPGKNLSRATAKILRIAAGKSTSLAKSYTKPISATRSTSPTSRLVRSTGKNLRGSTTPTKSILHSIGKILRASTTPTKIFIRSTSKTLRISAAVPARLARSTAKAFARAATVSARLVRAPTKLLRATSSPVGRVIRSTGKNLTRSVSAPARLVKSTGKILARATSSPVARLVRSTGKVLTRAATVTASLSKIASRGVLARVSATVTATLRRSTGKTLRQSTAPTSRLSRQISKLLRASGTAPARLVRSIAKTLRAASAASAALMSVKIPGGLFLTVATAPVARLVKSTAKTLRVAPASPASLLRSTGKALRAASAASARLVRSAAKAARASAAAAATLRRAPAKLLRASATGAARLTRSAAKALRTSSAAAATLRRSLSRRLQAATAPVASLIADAGNHVLARASTAPVASMTRRAAKTLARSTAPAARLVRTTSKHFAAASAASARALKSTAKALRVSTAAAARISHLPAKLLSIATAPAARLRRSVSKALRRAAAPRAALSRVLGRSIPASAVGVASTIASLQKVMVLTADVTVNAALLIVRGKTLFASTAPRATMEFVGTFSAKIAKIVLSILKTAVSLIISTAESDLEISTPGVDLTITPLPGDMAPKRVTIELTLTINGVVTMADQNTAVLGESVKFDASFLDFDGAPLDPASPTLKVTQQKAVSTFTLERESGSDLFSYVLDTSPFKPGPLYYSIHAESGGTKAVKEGYITLLANRATLNG